MRDELDPFDIAARLDELSAYRAGWLDGAGVALDPLGMDWLRAATESSFDPRWPRPRIFATPDGSISMEWSQPGRVADLEIDLADHKGAWLSVDRASGELEAEDLKLGAAEGWSRLGQLLAGTN